MIDHPPADLPSVGAPVEHGADSALDRLNLEQALRDFEVANRRVLDLTHRLATMHRELLDARTELNLTKIDLQQTRTNLERLTRSKAFLVLRSLARARTAVRR
jgi:hypothetical protein